MIRQLTRNLRKLTSLRQAPAVHCLVLLLYTGTAISSEAVLDSTSTSSFWDRTQVHGFLTQAWVKTDDNSFFGDSSSKYGSLEWYELGLNARTQINSRLDFAGQLMIREAGDMDKRSEFIEVDYLFADIALHDSIDDRVGLKLGRSRYQLGFFNATRDIAVTRPSIILPQSIYYDIARPLMTRQDGIIIYGSHTRGSRTDEWGAGYAFDSDIHSDDIETIFFDVTAPGKFKTDRVTQLYFGSEWANGFRVHASTATTAFDYDPAGSTDPLSDGRSKSTNYTLSFEYDTQTGHRWTQENFYGSFDSKDYGFPLADVEYDIWGNYLQYTRYWSKFEVFARYDYYRMDQDDRDKFLALGIPKQMLFAKDWSVGGRYFVTHNLSVSAEYHDLDGAGWIPRVENTDFTQIDRYWRILAMQINYSF